MKKLKSVVLMGALLIGSGAAVATTIHKLPNADDPTYDWDGTGPNGSGTLLDKTVTEARDFYGCHMGTNPCAEGNLASGEGPIHVEIFQP